MQGFGIVLLSHYRDAYYRMTANMAASLRLHMPEVPVAVITDNPGHPVWDSPICQSVELIRLQGEHNFPFYAKTVLSKYSPFNRTLYLDSDSLCQRSFKENLNSLESLSGLCPITIGSYNRENAADCPMVWADLPVLWDHYGFPEGVRYYELQSSVMYWTKSEQTDRLFTLAEHFYAEECFRDYNHNKGGIGHYPDELAFGVAFAMVGYDVPQVEAIKDLMGFRLRTEESPIYSPVKEPIVSLFGDRQTTHPHVYRWYNQAVATPFSKAFGAYGYPVTSEEKASNAHSSAPRYMGIRKICDHYKRPQKIEKLLKNE